MKVLYFIHNLHIGGAETIVTQYLIELHHHGIEVILVEENKVSSFLRDRIIDDGIRVYTLFDIETSNRVINKIYRMMHPTQKMWLQIIENEKPDIVHLHTNLENYCLDCFDPKKTVYSFHSKVRRSIEISSKENRRKIQYLADQGATFIALSLEMKEEIERILHTDLVVYVPNGVNIEEIKKERYDRQEMNQFFSIDEGAKIIGHVGRFDTVKNHERIIEIFNCLLKRDNNWVLLLVGTGSSSRIGAIRELARRYNVLDNVLFLGLRNDAVRIMSCFDVMLLPSFSESFSLVLLEAQVHNIACVASDAVPEEVICNDNCERVSLSEDNSLWADAILRNYCKKCEVNDSIYDFSVENVISKLIKEYELIIRG